MKENVIYFKRITENVSGVRGCYKGYKFACDVSWLYDKEKEMAERNLIIQLNDTLNFVNKYGIKEFVNMVEKGNPNKKEWSENLEKKISYPISYL